MQGIFSFPAKFKFSLSSLLPSRQTVSFSFPNVFSLSQNSFIFLSPGFLSFTGQLYLPFVRFSLFHRTALSSFRRVLFFAGQLYLPSVRFSFSQDSFIFLSPGSFFSAGSFIFFSPDSLSFAGQLYLPFAGFSLFHRTALSSFRQVFSLSQGSPAGAPGVKASL